MIGICMFVVFFIINVGAFPHHVDDERNSSGYKLYEKADWGAQPSTANKPLDKPVPYVVIHHTAVPGACNTTEECMADMRSMQNYHIGLDWGDIGYHFCVGSDGGVYEGRGWDVVGIHAGKANSRSLGVCLIGDWRVDEPPAAMLQATRALIEDGVRRGAVRPAYRLMGHGQIMATECPGTRLAREIASWDNYYTGVFDPNV